MAKSRPGPALPENWRSRPDLLPALRVWVEGARRVAAARSEEAVANRQPRVPDA